MKKILTLVLLTIGLGMALAAGAAAQSAAKYAGRVPFDFKVGKTAFPAGEYWIGYGSGAADAAILSIGNVKTGESRYLGTIIRRTENGALNGTLTFISVDGRWHLAAVDVPAFQKQLRAVKTEKEAVAGLGTVPKTAIVILGN